MSTGHAAALTCQAEASLWRLAQEQTHLLSIRYRQIKEANRETKMYSDAECRMELMQDAICEKVESICLVNALGTHGTTLEMLERVGELLRKLDEDFCSLNSQLAEALAERANDAMARRDDALGVT